MIIVIFILISLASWFTYLSFHYSADELDNMFTDFLINIFDWLNAHGHQLASIMVLILSLVLLFSWIMERIEEKKKLKGDKQT